MPKQGKVQSGETKQAFKPDLDIIQTLELSDKEYKITMTNMLRVLVQKLGNI